MARQGGQEAEDYMALAKRAFGSAEKGLVGFGGGISSNVFSATGVTYGTAPQGSQTYSANALVK